MTMDHTHVSGNPTRPEKCDSYSADSRVNLTLKEEIFESIFTLHSPKVNHLDKFMSGMGHYLRLQRENKSFSIQDLSYKSGVPVDIIMDLENGDFTEEQIEPPWIYKISHALSDNDKDKRDQIVSNIKLFTNRMDEADPYKSPYDLVVYWIESLAIGSSQRMQALMLIVWLNKQKKAVNNISETLILLASVAIAVESVNSVNRLPAQFNFHSVKRRRKLKHSELVFMSEYDIVRHWIEGFGEYSKTLKTMVIHGKNNSIPVGKMLLDWSELSLFPEVSTYLPVGNPSGNSPRKPQTQQTTTEAIEKMFGS